MIGAPEISTDGFLPYQNAIRDAFNGKAAHGVIVKTYSVTNLAVSRSINHQVDLFFGAQNLLGRLYYVGTNPTTIGTPRLVNGGIRLRIGR